VPILSGWAIYLRTSLLGYTGGEQEFKMDGERFLQLGEDSRVELTGTIFDGGRGSAEWTCPTDDVHLVLLRLTEGQGAIVVYGPDARVLRDFGYDLTRAMIGDRRPVRGFTESGQSMKKGARLPSHWLTAC